MYLVPSHLCANDSVNFLKVGVRSFEEPEGVCEEWNCVVVDSIDLDR